MQKQLNIRSKAIPENQSMHSEKGKDAAGRSNLEASSPMAVFDWFEVNGVDSTFRYRKCLSFKGRIAGVLQR